MTVWVADRDNVTHCLSSNDMLFLILVETRNTLDRHVVRLRGTRGENDVLGLRANQICDVLQLE